MYNELHSKTLSQIKQTKTNKKELNEMSWMKTQTKNDKYLKGLQCSLYGLVITILYLIDKYKSYSILLINT